MTIILKQKPVDEASAETTEGLLASLSDVARATPAMPTIRLKPANTPQSSGSTSMIMHSKSSAKLSEIDTDAFCVYSLVQLKFDEQFALAINGNWQFFKPIDKHLVFPKALEEVVDEEIYRNPDWARQLRKVSAAQAAAFVELLKAQTNYKKAKVITQGGMRDTYDMKQDEALAALAARRVYD